MKTKDKENTKIFKVGISGSYGGLNLGDEAILQSIITELRRSLPVEITVFTRNPEDTLRRHQVERVVPVRKINRNEAIPEIERLDLMILGGGGILFDPEVKIFLREVVLAQEKGVPVMVYSVGVGPLNDPASKELMRDCLNQVTVITVREREAQQVLEEIGVNREILVTADPALLLRPEPLPPGTLEREHLDGQRCKIGISVREPGSAAPDISEDHYHALLADAADYMVDRFDADVVFIPMERLVKDVQQSHAVVARMLRASQATVLKGEYTSGQVLSIIGHFAFTVGMRLHFLIFSAIQGVPFVALPYASKVSGFIDELHMATPPLKLVNAGRLIAYIDRSWDKQRLLQKQISRVLPQLKKRALENNTIAVRLLKEGRKRKEGPIRIPSDKFPAGG
ncbi:MAG: Poly(glycerol-phosphate) alpha-glucosyltransferase [Candidatus Jettenia ecosi]|uniref:Poly(Glycerol-phosphate) alpha-glucosyltransferase n=1 Tax=Candidatus Jettenia ecosi TaxID=2494326 RepID=A0A533QI00_9BACT|nr:MAG: Poly(glycerol-phosphate) alpha-glucosyltransferase [Candidatus Jettenia ecosi]